jgi:hypothetical protein
MSFQEFQVREAEKVPYYAASHTTPHTTLYLNKNREALRQRKEPHQEFQV